MLVETLKKTKEQEDPEDDDEAAAGNKMVGSRDQYSILKQQIVCGENVITSLVGMAGIGKTTLAREIFKDLDVVEEFKSEEIIESILAQVDPHVHEMAKGGNERMLVENLNKSLEGKVTLIVLDNLWGNSVFSFLEHMRLMNEEESCARVLLITTDGHVATDDAGNYFSEVVHMRLLNEEDSWDLLCVKVFGQESCPPQFEDPGKKIAYKCDGLPLTIVTVAHLLSEAGKIQESLWIEVATRKKHQILTQAYDDISKVLYPSYNNLKIQFYRRCFLYMGVFQINSLIPRSKIVNLFTAERLIPYFHDQEVSAARVLHHLAVCSLVMVSKKSTTLTPDKDDQRIKDCYLHSSWWHFCQREARKTNFFHVLDCPEDGLEKSVQGQSRLSIHNNVLFAHKDVYNSIQENCASTTQSLLCFGSYHKYQVPICFGLKLLQRLDALNIRFYEFPLEVLELVELTYLALMCNGKLPPSISKLLRLQFLIVHQCASIKSVGALTYLPMEIWDMKELKQLQIMGNDLPDSGGANLRFLKTLLHVSADSCTKGVLGRIPNLAKLGIRIEWNNDAAQPLRCFDHISHLFKLESLKCVVVNPKCKAEVVAPPAPLSIFLPNLKKLSLSGLGYPWEAMRRITSLPNLEVLKLQCNAFQGPEWEIEQDGFPKLHFLVIEDIDLVHLKGGRGSFKCLKNIRIQHCYKLEELHLGSFGIVDCNPLVEKKVKEFVVNNTYVGFPENFSVHSSWNS
ncbi:hypothetical protein ACS0TY_005908 [Phlomoides rotata]